MLYHLSCLRRKRPARQDAMLKAADPAADQLDDNMVATIYGYLDLLDIVHMRRVCKKWRDAAKKAIPMTEFCVDADWKFRAMVMMTTALPNLQQLSITTTINSRWSFYHGEDPVGGLPNQNDSNSFDINIISNFTRLRSLQINAPTSLNGLYPALFNFTNLQYLSMSHNHYLKWDLGMLSGFPLLRELDVYMNLFLRGSVRSLRVLKNSLARVRIADCPNVEGNFMDLSDFHLTYLDLVRTAVTGDVRDIGANDYSCLKDIILPKTVIGGFGYQFQHISEVPSVMNAVYLCMRRGIQFQGYMCFLARESPDWYDGYHDYNCPDHPFSITFVQIGPRLGWRWTNEEGDSCEINWLDPEEPERRVCDANARLRLQQIQEQIKFYKGYYEPPTELEYIRMCEEYNRTR